MPRPITKGHQAEYNHVPVVFSPFGAKPGASVVLTSDPWSFLRSCLQKKEAKSRQDNRLRLQRAQYFCSLAEEFYNSADSTRLPAKATLAYYGILNLAKCFICTQGIMLGDRVEHHGLSPTDTPGKDIKVPGRPKNHINIFHEFVAALGSPVPAKSELALEECIAHIPEVQGIASRLELLPSNSNNLLPVDIDILTDEKRQWLFSDISYAQRQESRFRTDKFLRGKRKTYFLDGREINGRILFRCRKRKKYSWDNFERIYGNLCSEYKTLDVVTLLTRDGYRYYCDLGQPSYHHLAYSFILMFYLGTTSRYRPKKTEELLDGELRPVIAESLSLTPRQVLYQLTSCITQSVCVVPYARL